MGSVTTANTTLDHAMVTFQVIEDVKRTILKLEWLKGSSFKNTIIKRIRNFKLEQSKGLSFKTIKITIQRK